MTAIDRKASSGLEADNYGIVSITLGPKGLYGNVILTSTGISYRTRLDDGSKFFLWANS